MCGLLFCCDAWMDGCVVLLLLLQRLTEMVGERVCWMVSWCVVVKLDSRSRLHVPCGWHAVTFPGISNNSKWNVPVSFILTYRPSGVLNLHKTRNKFASWLQIERDVTAPLSRLERSCLSLSPIRASLEKPGG